MLSLQVDLNPTNIHTSFFLQSDSVIECLWWTDDVTRSRYSGRPGGGVEDIFP